jgi:hypothetical protein
MILLENRRPSIGSKPEGVLFRIMLSKDKTSNDASIAIGTGGTERNTFVMSQRTKSFRHN